jgi:tartrate dehydratase alpha subunit/fumarate hydratase class I-like protein
MKFEIDEKKLHDAVVELIRRASTQLPADVISAMEKGRDSEEPGSPAQSVLKLMLENAQMAREDETPICQDTGTNIYYVTVPVGVSLRKVEKVIVEATKTATEKLIFVQTWSIPYRVRTPATILELCHLLFILKNGMNPKLICSWH